MGSIDIIVLVTVFLSIAFALYRGLVSELLSISGWILAAFGALYSYVPSQSLLKNLISDPLFAGITGAFVTALLILVVMTLLTAKITHHLRKSPLSGLDRTLGFLFGIFRAVLLIAVVYLIGNALIFSPEQIKKWEEENKSLPYIQKSAEFLEAFVPQSIKDDIGGRLKEKEEKQETGAKEVKKPDPDKKAPGKKTTKSGKKSVPVMVPKKPAEKQKKGTGGGYTDENRDDLNELIKSMILVEDIS